MPVLLMDGLTVSQFSGEELALRLRAEHLRVVPRRFGPFYVGTIREAELSRVRCELFELPRTRGNSDSGPPHLALLRSATLLAGSGSRDVTAVSFRELDCTVSRSGTLVTRFTAVRGEMSGERRELLLRRFRLEKLPAGPTLTADTAVWSADSLLVRGAYELRSNGGEVVRGKGIRLDL